jgi:GntR family transcriptional repressor for pyruvate dehydrogenase complex
MHNFPTIVTDSAPKQIAQTIKDAILSGKLKVDERLPTEDELSAKFSVSRHTIREALKRLAAENLVEARRGATGGNFVKMPTWIDIQTALATSLTVAASLNQLTFQQVIDCRLEIGSMCCRLAATNRASEDLKAMRREIAIQRHPELSDVDFCASDVRFHCRIAAASGNPIIAASAAGILEGLEPITNLLLFRFRLRNVISEQHAAIADCLAAHDAEGAVEHLRLQIDYLKKKHADAKRWKKTRGAAERRAHEAKICPQKS